MIYDSCNTDLTIKLRSAKTAFCNLLNDNHKINHTVPYVSRELIDKRVIWLNIICNKS